MEDDNMLLEYEWADVHSYLMLRKDGKWIMEERRHG